MSVNSKLGTERDQKLKRAAHVKFKELDTPTTTTTTMKKKKTITKTAPGGMSSTREIHFIHKSQPTATTADGEVYPRRRLGNCSQLGRLPRTGAPYWAQQRILGTALRNSGRSELGQQSGRLKRADALLTWTAILGTVWSRLQPGSGHCAGCLFVWLSKCSMQLFKGLLNLSAWAEPQMGSNMFTGCIHTWPLSFNEFKLFALDKRVANCQLKCKEFTKGFMTATVDCKTLTSLLGY